MAKPLLLIPPPDPVKLLQDLKGLVPKLGRIVLPVGKIVSLSTLAATLPQAFKARLRNILKQTARDDRDNQQVVKVADAVDCVNRTLADPVKVYEMVVLLLTDITETAGQTELGKPICDCIREKALRQDTPRVLSSKRRYHRPSKGHGHGR